MGQQLLQARQRRKLTLAEISRNTKIPVHTLEAIERDDAGHLPPEFFTRAFVRTYAREVGIDPSKLLDAIEPEPSSIEPDQQATVSIDRESAFPASMFLLVSAAVVCGVLVGRFTAAPPADESRVANAAVTQHDKSEPAADLVPTETSVVASGPGTVDVEFEVKSHDGCFVAVSADGRETGARAVQQGKPVTVKARGEVVLRLTDAGACAAIEQVAPASSRRAEMRSTRVARVAADQSAAAAVPDADPVAPAPDAAPAPADSIALPPAAEQF